jgi:hypothetical protein
VRGAKGRRLIFKKGMATKAGRAALLHAQNRIYENGAATEKRDGPDVDERISPSYSVEHGLRTASTLHAERKTNKEKIQNMSLFIHREEKKELRTKCLSSRSCSRSPSSRSLIKATTMASATPITSSSCQSSSSSPVSVPS